MDGEKYETNKTFGIYLKKMNNYIRIYVTLADEMFYSR